MKIAKSLVNFFFYSFIHGLFFIIPAIPKVFKRLKQNIFGPAEPRHWETINSKRTDGK